MQTVHDAGGRQLSAPAGHVCDLTDRPWPTSLRTEPAGRHGTRWSRAAAPWRRRLGERERFMLLLIAPAATVLFLFQIFPILIGANASFRNWPLYDPCGEWLGLQHYIRVLTDPVFLGVVMPNTLLLMVLSVSIGLVPRAGAGASSEPRLPGQRLVQTVLLLPLMIAPVIASMMMRWMFNDQFGIVAVVWEGLGFAPQAWLAARWPAFAIIVFTDVWIWTPWFTIILLAGLKSLPREPYEAAAIDAATKWRMFTHLTLPMLRPVIAVCVVIRAIDAFRTFDQVWVITQGGPARQTEVFSVYAYVEAFHNLNFGRGSAAAIIGAIDHHGARHRALPAAGPLHGRVAMSTPATALPDVGRGGGFFDALAPGGRKVLFVLALIGVLFLFGFPAFWLILTSLRPGWAVFYVHRGTDFTIHNYVEVLAGRHRRPGLRQQLRDRHARDGLLARRDHLQRLHALALQGPGRERLVRHDLRVPHRALHLVGAAALLRHPVDGRLRHLCGAAAAAHRRAHLLLLVDDEGLLRFDRPVDGARRADRRLHALGRVPARGAAVGDPRHRGARRSCAGSTPGTSSCSR